MAGGDKRKKKKRKTRQKDWRGGSDAAFSRDLKRHLHTDTALSAAAPAPDIPDDFEPNALVVSRSRKWAFVLGEAGETLCRISDYLVDRGATVLAPGDRVLIEEMEGEPWVRAVAERTSRLSRLAIEHSAVAEQVFAANVDILVVVASAAMPEFKPGLVDRYLIAADVGGVTPILCVNKIDLVEDEPGEVAPYRELGIGVLQTSAESGAGLDELRGALRGKLSVFCGHSGVGKSSLLNALEPELDLATREVSEQTRRGKHTTTASRLYVLEDGIRIIDTPGVRQLGLWSVSAEEVGYYFPEIAEVAPACKFRDCTHVHEPECAVRDAVESGDVARQRYDSYLRIRESIEAPQAHRRPGAASERKS